MKKVKKIVALMLAAVMMLAMGVTALAQDIGTAATGTATITIKNASKGEEYAVYKLFDATVTGNANGGSIAYTGNIPTDTVEVVIGEDDQAQPETHTLGEFFEKNAQGNISVKAGIDQDVLFAVLKAYVEQDTVTADATAVSDGSVLNFNGLPYGYYVVTTTQGASDITVTSTNPNATIYDKNRILPGPVNPTTPVKSSNTNNDGVNIGDTVTYTITFQTTNFSGVGADAKRIVSYTIKDTLPDFLKDVTVTSIIVDEDGDESTETDNHDVTKQFTNKAITIDWIDNTTTQSLYDNGSVITITYTATVTDEVAIDGTGNTNAVTISWATEGTEQPTDTVTGSETIYTYAIALKKVNDAGLALSGATFQFPFYVQATPDADDGAYIYAGTTPPADGDTSITNTITTPASGEIVVKGVKAGTYSITETAAPAGYNKLATPVTVTAVKTGETTTEVTKYIDKDGNVSDTETTVAVTYENNNLAATPVFVVNKTGALLPSTGGMGTTIFYILGGILVIGAAVLLVTRRRMRGME